MDYSHSRYIGLCLLHALLHLPNKTRRIWPPALYTRWLIVPVTLWLHRLPRRCCLYKVLTWVYLWMGPDRLRSLAPLGLLPKAPLRTGSVTVSPQECEGATQRHSVGAASFLDTTHRQSAEDLKLWWYKSNAVAHRNLEEGQRIQISTSLPEAGW